MTGTVKAVGWQLLDGEFGRRLQPGGFEALVRDVGGPELARVHPLADVPAAPFNEALARVEAALGGETGAVARDAAAAVVRVWANLHPDAARALTTDAGAALDALVGDVHAFATGTPGGARVESRGAREGVLAFEDAFKDAFRAGLVAGALRFVDADARVDALGGGRYRVTWSFPGTAPARAPLAVALAAVRAPFLLVALVPVIVGAAAAAGATGALDAGLLALTALGIVSILGGMHALNDYFDARSGADDANPTPTKWSGGSRLIQRGVVSPRAMLALGLTLVGAGSAMGGALYLARGLPVLAFGVAGVLAGVLYSAPPVKLAHRGLGEAAFAVILGPLVVLGSAIVQAGAVPAAAAWASVPVGLLVAAVLVVNEFPDLRGDALTGKRTLVVRLGLSRATRAWAAVVAAAFVSILLGVALDVLPVLALSALAPAPLAVYAWRVLRARSHEPYRLLPAQAASLALHVATGLLLAVALAWGVSA